MSNFQFSSVNFKILCYCLLLFANFFLSSCTTKQKISEAISFDNDSTKHVFSYAGKKNQLIRETTWYPSGNLKSEYNFNDSLLHGPFKTMAENGNSLQEGVYFNGMENGLFKYYDVNGLITIEGYLKNGKKEGIWTTWYDDVQKKEEMHYKDDMLNGIWTHWFIDGNLMREETYENGKKIKEQVYE